MPQKRSNSNRGASPITCILIAFVVALIFFAAAALSLYAPERAIYKDAPLSEFEEQLDSVVRRQMRRYAVPGATIAVVRNGEIVYTAAYGDADRETGRKMTADMPMRVESISKSVTAWAVMKLAEEGKIDLDEPLDHSIEDWKLPASPYASDGVTARLLLCHAAGLPLGNIFARYAPGEAVPSLKESLTESAVLFQAPGESFSYSNVGYNLLELLIEEVTGRAFSEYMKNEILIPLGMKDADFAWNAESLAAAPRGHTPDGKTVAPYRYPESASGGLLATAEDIARFCIAGMPEFSKQKVLSHDGVEQLYAPRMNRLGAYSLAFDAYGFGYYTEGDLTVSNGGQGYGWMSQFYAVPETGDAIVILTNSQRSWPFIAGVLHGWARWRGFSPPGMTRILLGECVLWALVGALAASALLLVIRMVTRIATGGMRFVRPRFTRADIPRMMQLGLSVSSLAGLAWCAAQPYLFITSVFPATAGWLGLCAAILAAELLIFSFGANVRSDKELAGISSINAMINII